VVSFSTPLGLHDFILYLAMKLELFVVAFFLEPAAVGIYALAAELAFVMKKFRQIFDPILLPILSEARGGGQEERVQENLARVVRWILVPGILYLAAMALFARPILGVFGEEFRTGGMVLILLCGAQLANVGTGPLDLAMIASGRPRINLLNISLILVVQTGLNLWLIPRYGLTGAGAAALAAFLFVGLLRFGQGLLILGVNPFHSAQLKPLAAGVVAGLGVALGGWLLPSSDLPFLWVGGLVAMALLYVLVLWLLGLEEEDTKLVKTLVSGGRG
jgi:O-antigen/teichoic acid export membrane protein